MSYYSVGKFIKLRTDTSSIYTPQFSFSRKQHIPDTNAFKHFKKNSCLATLHDFKSIHETLQSNQNIKTKQCYFTNNGLTIDQLEEHCKATSGDKWIVLKWWNTCDALDDCIDDKLLNKFGKEVKELVESDDDDDDVIQVNKEEEMLELMKKNWKKGVKDIMDRVIVRQKEKTDEDAMNEQEQKIPETPANTNNNRNRKRRTRGIATQMGHLDLQSHNKRRKTHHIRATPVAYDIESQDESGSQQQATKHESKLNDIECGAAEYGSQGVEPFLVRVTTALQRLISPLRSLLNKVNRQNNKTATAIQA
eukprot:231472_1